MMPIANHNPLMTPTQALLDTAPRRRMQGEISHLKAEIIELKKAQDHQPAHNDGKTQLIDIWVNNFIAAFRTREEVEIIQHEFIILLETILADPLLEITEELLGFDAFYVSVDADALIGSDTETYGRKTLSIFLNHIPVAQRNRSPLHPGDATPFITNPHRVIRRLVEWLETKKPLTTLPEIENAFNALSEEQRVSPLSEWENAQLREISELGERQDNEQITIIAEMWQTVNVELAAFRQHAEERFRPPRERREAHDRKMAMKVLRSEERAESDAKALLVSVQKLDRQMVMIAERNQKFRESLSSDGSRISDIERSKMELELKVNEVREGIIQYKKQIRKNLIKDGVICATSVFGTWALSGTGAILPSRGGAMIKTTIPF